MPTGPLFTQMELTGVNALTAGSFDASTSFDANTPLSHVAYSLGVLGMYFSPAPNARPDAVIVKDDCAEGRNIFGGCGPIIGKGGPPMKSDGDTSGMGGMPGFGGLISEDTLRRMALFIVAVVVLAVALWKL